MDIRKGFQKAEEKLKETFEGVKEPIEETAIEAEKKDEEVVPDRGAFNCPDCQGQGLITENNKQILCPVCNGKGKIN